MDAWSFGNGESDGGLPGAGSSPSIGLLPHAYAEEEGGDEEKDDGTEPGDDLGVGERFGLIRFGSRVDLYLPTPNSINVKMGDRVKAGTTVIGRWA